ncbi:MAG: HEAT repeat domain-containing protein [Armatimonadetes bacterium]|nr:HEAT repeat domain-containing protein [Armatimonadota bacterium]
MSCMDVRERFCEGKETPRVRLTQVLNFLHEFWSQNYAEISTEDILAEYDVIDLLGLVDESYQSDLPLCIQALADPSEDYNVRRYALSAILRIGYQAEEVVGVLIQLLDDDNPEFRLDAARLLGKVIGANRFSAADALARRVRDWRWTAWVQIQVRAFVSLTRLVGLRNALKRVLLNPSANPFVEGVVPITAHAQKTFRPPPFRVGG